MAADEYDVFVSYAPEDAAWVRVLAERLCDAGLRVVLPTDVLPGEVILHRVERSIQGADIAILVLSRASMAEFRVAESELIDQYAVMHRRALTGLQHFIPLLLDDVTVPEFAAIRRPVDFRDADGPAYDRRVAELVAAIRGERPEPDPAARAQSELRLEGPRSCLLRVTADKVIFALDGEPEIAHTHNGMSARLEDLHWRLDNARQHGEQKAQISGSTPGSGHETALTEFGRALGDTFLSGAAGQALTVQLARAQRMNSALRLGIEITDGLADLPWETLIPPGLTEPLALHTRVHLFRRSPSDETPFATIPGPLRILVCVASPEGPGGGTLLNFEAESARILDAVDPARTSGAYVRILNEGNLEAIRAALLAERFHVLHISCHAGPNVLVLEDAQGIPDRVETERFVREALPADRSVPLVVLSGCATALSARTVRAGETAEGEAALSGLARGLTAAGVPAVLAMTAPVTDLYATAVAGAFYRELALRRVPEVLPAFCDARRRQEEARLRLPQTHRERELIEWATPALFLRGPSLPLYDPDAEQEPVAPTAPPDLPEDIPLRPVGDFVGRRAELRTMRAALRGTNPGVLVHGIGGVGKSSLAAELLRQLDHTDTGLVVSTVSQTSPDQILDEVGRALFEAGYEPVRRLALSIRDPSKPWDERLHGLAALLANQPVTLLLDNFEDNLHFADDDWALTDDELAGFLAAWIRAHGRGKVIITSRYRFPLPKRADRRLMTHHLGPLSWPETRKLLWRLPALDYLPAADQLRAYADVGGHPRTLEYLDAVLRGGHARFDDVTERLEDLLERRGITDPDTWFRGAGADLDRALAESVTLAVNDTLLGDLVGLLDETTRSVLIGASVYRIPVDRIGVAWPVSQQVDPLPDPDRDARLERINSLLAEARRIDPRAGVADLGLSGAELDQLRADQESLQVPPLIMAEGLDRALEVLGRLGLVSAAPLADSNNGQGEVGWVVHRWTAATLARPELTDPQVVRSAHASAAAYWRWRAGVCPESPNRVIEQLLEARFHHHTAGDLEASLGLTDLLYELLRIWGAWGWEEQLCRETLTWLTPGSRGSAAAIHRLGNIARRRGDYDRALDYYEQAFTISEELGNRADVAASYHQMGVVAQDRGDYKQALDYHRKSLGISEELGDRAGVAVSYHELGMIAQEQRDFDRALNYYRQSLAIKETLGNGIGAANSYDQLGVVAQRQGDYEQALHYHRKSLGIRNGLGDRAGVAASYHHLGSVAHLRGDYDEVLNYYRQSLAICEKLGDWAGASSNYHRLGALFTDTGQFNNAVGYTLRSLTIGLQLGSPDASIDLHWLSRQRHALGHNNFGRVLADHLDPESAGELIRTLDDYEARNPPS